MPLSRRLALSLALARLSPLACGRGVGVCVCPEKLIRLTSCHRNRTLLAFRNKMFNNDCFVLPENKACSACPPSFVKANSPRPTTEIAQIRERHKRSGAACRNLAGHPLGALATVVLVLGGPVAVGRGPAHLNQLTNRSFALCALL